MEPQRQLHCIEHLNASERLRTPSLFCAGDIGTEFFALAAGSVSVIKDGQRIGGMRAPDYFGELALHTQAPRAATIQVTLSRPRQARRCVRVSFRFPF